MTIPFAALDQQELVQLAVDAINRQDTDMALAYLEEATERGDASAVGHFLLGSQYAQLQVQDRAIQAMETAIAMDPGLAIARFQLGLFHLSSGNVQRATELLEVLVSQGKPSAIVHFARGLLHLIRDEFSETVQELSEGIHLNTENSALNQDMQKILNEVTRLDLEKKDMNKVEDTEDGQHVFLSVYKGGPTR